MTTLITTQQVDQRVTVYFQLKLQSFYSFYTTFLKDQQTAGGIYILTGKLGNVINSLGNGESRFESKV